MPVGHFHLDDSNIVESQSDIRSSITSTYVNMHRQDGCLQIHSPSFHMQQENVISKPEPALPDTGLSQVEAETRARLLARFLGIDLGPGGET